MSQIKHYIFALLLVVNYTMMAQNSISEDPETVSNSIKHYISQAQNDVNTGNYFSAQKNLEKALDDAVKIDDKRSIGLIHSNIGKLFYLLEDYDKALLSLTKAVEFQRTTNDYANNAETYKTFGNVYMSKHDYNQALEYYTSSKSLFEQVGNSDEYIAEILYYEGKIFNETGKYKQAKQSLEQCLVLGVTDQPNEIDTKATIQLSIAQLNLGNKEEALKLASEGLKEAKQLKLGNATQEVYLALSEIYERVGDQQLSNKYLKQYIKLSDSLFEVKKLLFTKAKSQYLLANKDAIQQQNLADLEEEQQAENSLNQLTTILSIALITILSLLTLSLYKNNNIRLKTNNMLHKKNSELIVAKEKAELASKTKANFLSTVTHELRTPLYAVTGITNMLLDENPKPEQVQHLKSLKFSGEYLLTFINDILQINKIEANKVDLDPEVFNLKKKIENVISALNNSAVDNSIKMHFDFDKNLPEVYNADQLKISQILINLIGNSIKFTKDGDIWIRVYKIDQKDKTYTLRFEVEDNGIGISKEKQENMFESFSQGSIQINRKYGGTGLGLSIVKGLIDILKGKIYLKSELGKGSTFIFEIPLEYSTETVTEKKTDFFKDVDEVELSNIKILVVEDNKINQMITKKILNKMKLNCDLVDNGEAAVDMVKNGNYDVVLMDIHMPGISGMEATTMIRAFDKELTIFALTAVTIEDKMQEFEDAGFTDIISKPFKQEDFEKKLFNALIVNRKNSVR